MENELVEVYVPEPTCSQRGVFQKGTQMVSAEMADWLEKHRIATRTANREDRNAVAPAAQMRETAVKKGKG